MTLQQSSKKLSEDLAVLRREFVRGGGVTFFLGTWVGMVVMAIACWLS